MIIKEIFCAIEDNDYIKAIGDGQLESIDAANNGRKITVKARFGRYSDRETLRNAELAVRKGIEMIHFTHPKEEEACAIDAYLTALEARRAPILREAAEDPEIHASIQRGRRLFYGPKTQCASCHTGEFFTDGKLHDVGTATTYEARPMDTPTLRECWRTAPYLHDGRYRTILEMLRDGRHGFSAELSEQELKDLEAFVLSL